ncbi:MAG: hypothetical protein KA278_01175 [Flavobacterium sp.]|nr:hypothetical protein [Flavobacterium sp.]
MKEESNHPNENQPDIELNYDYSVGVVKSLKGKILIGHVEEMYPRVHEKLFLEGSLMPYIEPKIMKQLDLENSYRLQGYPINGLSEIARNDVYSMIKDELGPFEQMELAKEFDMDINPIIDSQSIQ